MSKSVVNILILVRLAALLIISLFALMQNKANAASTRLDEKTLEKKAIVEATRAGLQGAPIAKRSVQMTLAEWLTLVGAGLGPDATAPTAVVPINAETKPALNDAESEKGPVQFGLTPDIPVYVLAMRGDVIWRLPAGPPRPGHSQPELYDNITVVLDARTGSVIWIVAAHTSSSMPISVPLPSYP